MLRSIEADMRRSAREAERRQKRQAKLQALEDAENTVNAFEEYIKQITSIHTDCNSKKNNWNAKAKKKPPSEPKRTGYNEANAQSKYENFKPNILNKIFRNVHKKKTSLKHAITKAIGEDESQYQSDLSDFIKKYALWEKERDIAEKLLNKDPKSYLDAVLEFNPFLGIEELGSSLRFNIDETGNMTVNLNVHSEEVVPQEKYSLRQSGTLSTKKMPKGEFNELYQDYVCSCVLRVARELYELLPIDKVLVNANDDILNPKTGHVEEQTILSVIFVRDNFERLNLYGIDPSDSMKNFLHNMKFKKTTWFGVVESLSEKIIELT